MTETVKVGTRQITYDDIFHRVSVNGGRQISLSPTQYRIFRSFFPPLSGEGEGYGFTQKDFTIISFLYKAQLQQAVGLTLPTLKKHISNINNRLWMHGIQIQSFREGYFLVCKSQEPESHYI
jgi:hypothetical protein